MELIVPTLGESITEATVSKWLKKVGDSFDADEPLVEIETDKITVEVPAPSAGSITEIKVEEGVDVNIGGVLALLGDQKASNTSSTPKDLSKKEAITEEKKEEMKIIATGGLASLLQSTELLFDNVEENLTMHGLRLIFDYNIKSIDSL